MRRKARDSRLRSIYGISLDEWDAMWIEQGGKCEVCHEGLQPGNGKHALDHCHTTGRVRSLLCTGCNTALGSLKEDPVRIRALLDYLETHAPR